MTGHLKMPLLPGERVLRSAFANIAVGDGVLIGGHLHLTSARLIFETLFGMHTRAVPLQTIVSVEARARHILGLLPVHNHLSVATRDGDEMVFATQDRDGWVHSIQGARSGGPSVRDPGP